MILNEDEVNKHLQPLIGQYEDSIQQAWVEILERNPQTIGEIAPIARKVRNKAINQYLNRKYREESLYKPLGKNGNEGFTLESILESPSTDDSANEREQQDNSFYEKIVNFLIGEYHRQKNENIKLKRREIELKAERLRLREESLKFKRDRFESWKRLVEEKGKQQADKSILWVQLQREKLQFRREQLLLKERKRACRQG